MRKLIFTIVILGVAVWLGILIHHDAGYVLIAYGNYSIETSLWVGLVLLAALFTVGHYLVRLLRHTRSIHHTVRNWRRNRQSKKSRQLTHSGLRNLAEGHWKEAETKLIKSAKISTNPLINYLAAARAAQAQHALDRRDQYLTDAHKTNKHADLAITLTQAQLQIASQQWEQALASLQHIHRISPLHPLALKLLQSVYIQLNDWHGLQKLVPSLKKSKALSEIQLQTLEKQIYQHLIEATATNQGVSALKKLWSGIPSFWRNNPDLVYLYSRKLIENDRAKEAANLIETTLKKYWDKRLIQAYAQTQADSRQQLNTAETWLKKYPRDANLLLCLGLLSCHENLWGKAKQYLQQSITIEPSEQTYKALGKVCEMLEEDDKALKYYRQALALQP